MSLPSPELSGPRTYCCGLVVVACACHLGRSHLQAQPAPLFDKIVNRKNGVLESRRRRRYAPLLAAALPSEHQARPPTAFNCPVLRGLLLHRTCVLSNAISIRYNPCCFYRQVHSPLPRDACTSSTRLIHTIFVYAWPAILPTQMHTSCSRNLTVAMTCCLQAVLNSESVPDRTLLLVQALFRPARQQQRAKRVSCCCNTFNCRHLPWPRAL